MANRWKSGAGETEPRSYTRMSLGGKVIGGIDLSTGTPFITFDSPSSETTYPVVDLGGVKKLTIAVEFGSTTEGVSLHISNSVTGAELFSQADIAYPDLWSWTGTKKAAWTYYGTTGDTGTHTLYIQNQVSTR